MRLWSARAPWARRTWGSNALAVLLEVFRPSSARPVNPALSVSANCLWMRLCLLLLYVSERPCFPFGGAGVFGPTSSRSLTARVHACIDVHLCSASAALWMASAFASRMPLMSRRETTLSVHATYACRVMTLLSVCLNSFLNACLCLFALASRLFCFLCVHTCGFARRLHLSRRTRDRVHARLLYRVAHAPDGTEKHAMPAIAALAETSTH